MASSLAVTQGGGVVFGEKHILCWVLGPFLLQHHELGCDVSREVSVSSGEGELSGGKSMLFSMEGVSASCQLLSSILPYGN